MALTYVNLSGYQRGVASDETAVNCSSFAVTVKPEINDWLPGITGQAKGKAVGDPEGELTMDFEIGGSTGIMAAVFTTAFVPVNTTTYAGRSQGGFYMDEITVTQEREGWKKGSAKFTSKYNVP